MDYVLRDPCCLLLLAGLAGVLLYGVGTAVGRLLAALRRRAASQ